MKLGLGFYRDMLTPENFQFARQCGCTHIVAHLVNYFSGGDIMPEAGAGNRCWGVTPKDTPLWTLEMLKTLRRGVEQEGLRLEAIENFDPAHWYDILLDGPERDRQIEGIKTMIRRVGDAGIPIIGYNFSIAGVWGHDRGKFARGGAESVAFRYDASTMDRPLPRGHVWNMVYDPEAPQAMEPSFSHDELWRRLERFLEAVVPVAAEAGVRLAAHPDDPPMPTLRGMPRLVYQPDLYQRLLDLVPNHANALEFCLGSLQEMSEGNIYDTIDHYGRQNAIAYVHFRNVTGKVPDYREVFVDEGDIDMLRALRILKANRFDGVLIPDHTPLPTCAAGWHAGMAYALGYMRAALRAVNEE